MKRKLPSIISFVLIFYFHTSQMLGQEFKSSSALKDGQLFKIAVAETGIYKIDYSFLKDQVKLNVDQLSTDQLHILGNRGGVVPQSVSSSRIDDLEALAYYESGLDDGSFDNGDYILFYAEGPDGWTFQPAENTFQMLKNPYEDFNYYFIKVGTDPIKKAGNRANASNPEYATSIGDSYLRFEEDNVNLLGKFRSPGAGKLWFGDEFSSIREISYSDEFELKDFATAESATIDVRMAGRAGVTSSFNLHFDGQTFSQNINRVTTSDFEDDYARLATLSAEVLASKENPNISVEYPIVSGNASSAWLDYIQINYRRNLIYNGEPLQFRDQLTSFVDVSEYQISGASQNLVLFDITNPVSVINQEYVLNPGQLTYTVENGQDLLEFILFDPAHDYTRPTFIENVPNQNLHGMTDPELLIIYHPDFKEAAENLAVHRSTHSNIDVSIVNIFHVYNEFAGGSQDATAIRDMARMLYSRSVKFKYLLLLGDGTYDFRHRNENAPDDNFIPAYETNNSLDPIAAFPSDDYYALLDENEGGNLRGQIDIAVGRIPVKTAEEANAVVNKIIRYDIEPKSLGDWRLRLGFVADDEDSNLHFRQSNNIAEKVENDYPFFNQTKIFLDAFKQQSTPGGERYPDATEAINNNMFKGLLVLNYLGHGGQTGWAEERVLLVNDILSWKNINRLPLFITATCSFTGYDEPNVVSAGEHVILNPAGGAVALMTTVRAVYSSSNERLTKAVFDNLFRRFDGSYLPIGEVMRVSKNSNPADTIDINARKFALIGDPSMHLAIPKHKIITTSVNEIPYSGGIIDTIRALEKVDVKGHVANQNDQILTDFNGILQVTVFDKQQIAKTLRNDERSQVQEFSVQNRVIFKGTATVKAGKFQFSFVVPQDIKFDYGKGKISYYATDNKTMDAMGSFTDIIIGGTSSSGIVDDQGPDIKIYFDDRSFISGGTTGPDPVLILDLADDNGINVAGTSIGHDLEAKLDQDSRNTFILNDFYQATADDYTSGSAMFPLSGLAEGLHTINVTAWDIANNFSEAESEFFVTTDPQEALKHVLNYPNPFFDQTYFQFDHSRSGVPMDVTIQIFSSDGHLVKTIEELNLVPTGNRVSGIEWDGLNDSGGGLSSGIYLYQVRVLTKGGNTREISESKFEKLVLLK